MNGLWIGLIALAAFVAALAAWIRCAPRTPTRPDEDSGVRCGLDASCAPPACGQGSCASCAFMEHD